MKAIRYSRLGGPEVLQYVDVPVPEPKTGEVLFRVKSAAVNHLDLHFRRGLPGLKTNLPHIPGSDGAGIVEAIGPGVTNVKVGDRVYMNPSIFCESCERCLAGEHSLCHLARVIGRETDGTYAEFAVIPAKNALPLPESVSFEKGAAAPLVYVTAWSMVITKGALRRGQTVLVMGAGSGVSMAAIQITKHVGATVFTTASTDEKTMLAKEKLGADEVINYTKKEIDKEVRSLTNRKGVDLVIDHIGGDQWVPILRATRNGGTVITCGATAGFEPKEDLRQIFYRQVRVLGSTMGTDHELAAVMKLVFEGKLNPIIDSKFKLKDAAAAHARMESRQSFGKILIEP